MTATGFEPLPTEVLDRFVTAHRLPDRFRGLARTHYALLADWVRRRHEAGQSMLLGINGAQGTGKSTLAAFLKETLETMADWTVMQLSIDDFYLTRTERERLARDVHPLLRTRGVPGTHDVPMLCECIDNLRMLGPGETLTVPRFDKARDERAGRDDWPTVTGPVNLIVLEGWCVGTRAQPDIGLHEPLNTLEREHDPDASWRRYVNERLRREYATLFASLDALVFLQAPGLDAVYRWRLEQERQLPAGAPAAMNDAQIARFIQHFERLTRANLVQMPATADVVLELDDSHGCTRSCYRWPSSASR